MSLWRHWFRRDRLERELDEEMRFHIEAHTRDLIAEGVPPGDARRRAMAAFGGLEPIKESVRQTRRSRWLADVVFDLRYAARALRREPSFTIVAVLALTLGIGATTAVFSAVDAVVVRPLPFNEPERLVAVGQRQAPNQGAPAASTRDPQGLSSVAPQNYLDWVVQQRVFSSIAAMAISTFTMRQPGVAPEDIRAVRVTATFFDVLRLRPPLGRPFTAENEIEGRHRVALLGEGLWRERFGADPAVLGRTVQLDDGNYQIIGVMPSRLAYPVGADTSATLWIPYVVPQNEHTRRIGWQRTYLQSIARLKPGISIEVAQAEMDRVANALEQSNPVWNRGSRIGVRPLQDHIVGSNTKSWLLLLLGAVAIVLFIACANVANLLIARTGLREREIAVRAALGAGRARLIRQFMIESLLLAAIGAVLSTVLAWWAIELLRNAIPSDLPRASAIALDYRVLLAATVLSLATGLLCGFLPAIYSSRPDLSRSLKDRSRASGLWPTRRSIRSVFVIAELALSMVLVVASTLFIGSFVRLLRVDPGFDPTNVLTVRITPYAGAANEAPHATAAPMAAFAEILDRLAVIPGVTQASAVFGGLPLSNSSSTTSFRVYGKPVQSDNWISERVVTPNYHQTLKVPLRRGRFLSAADRAGAQQVVVINEAATRKYFGEDDPVGRIVTVNNEDRVVVGVVADIHQRSLEVSPGEEAYMPVAQKISPAGTLNFWTSTGELVIRTSDDPYKILPAIRSIVLEPLPDVPLRAVTTLDERVGSERAGRKFQMLLFGLFGVLGLMIAAVGVYGVMASTVAQQTREIGVRMALGATRGVVLVRVFRHAGFLVGIGLAAGSATAYFLSATARTFLFGVSPTDPRAFVAALITLTAAALIATLVPAKRAASVDPIVALRAE